MVHFATEACLQVSVFILMWDWKKSGMFVVNCDINLFKIRVNLPSMAIYFMYFINKSKLWWTPLLSKHQVVLSMHVWSNSDMLGKALLDSQRKQGVHHTYMHGFCAQGLVSASNPHFASNRGKKSLASYQLWWAQLHQSDGSISAHERLWIRTEIPDPERDTNLP